MFGAGRADAVDEIGEKGSRESSDLDLGTRQPTESVYRKGPRVDDEEKKEEP